MQTHLLKADNCGEFSVTTGYWDYCLYKDSSNLDYVSKNWEEKVEIIMERVMNSDPPSGKGFDVDSKRNIQYQTTGTIFILMFVITEIPLQF